MSKTKEADVLKTENAEERNRKRSDAWRAFFGASTRLNGALEANLKRDVGVTLSDYSILLALYESPKYQLRMGEISQLVGFSPSRLTYLVSQMVKAKLIARVPSGDDGRGYLAQLTTAGKHVAIVANSVYQETVRERVLDKLSDEEIDCIVHLIERADRSV